MPVGGVVIAQAPEIVTVFEENGSSYNHSAVASHEGQPKNPMAVSGAWNLSGS
jgi:hypothetical protein